MVYIAGMNDRKDAIRYEQLFKITIEIKSPLIPMVKCHLGSITAYSFISNSAPMDFVFNSFRP